jgi:hypothetical protein
VHDSGASRREIAEPHLKFNVIASAAKQSISPRKGRMDCFVASLLAMTVSELAVSKSNLKNAIDEDTPHSQPSSPAKAGDPVFQRRL